MPLFADEGVVDEGVGKLIVLRPRGLCVSEMYTLFFRCQSSVFLDSTPTALFLHPLVPLLVGYFCRCSRRNVVLTAAAAEIPF